MLSFACMSHAKRWIGMAAAVFVVGTACGDMGSSMESAAGSGGQDAGNRASEASGTPDTNAPGAPTATGIVVVHAAAFPSFRLCFESQPELVPQPDSKLMPAANVVGVEIGSVVRLGPLKAPGRIYVVNERAVRSTAGDPNGVPCGELITDVPTSVSLIENSDYFVASVKDKPLGLDAPLGENRVQVLAITGCGNQAYIDRVGAKSESCGPDWNVTSGNLTANVIDLPATGQRATASSIPVQLVHLAPALQAQLGTATLDVTFGELASPGRLPTPVADGTPLLGSSEHVTLNIDQSDEKIYGTHGFRVEARELDAGAKFSFDHSLAAIQDLSSPSDVPTTYYRVASNYALLLLGDPSVPSTLDGGAPNPDRRRVQLLAVPVLDPTAVDAGADASPTTGDGGS